VDFESRIQHCGYSVAARTEPNRPSRRPRAAREGSDDITAFADFPVPHWKRSGRPSAGTIKQRGQALHRRRRRLPNPAALLRLAGSVLVEAHDEWQVADKRYLSETTLALFQPAHNNNDQSITVAITA
jgi:putative transposase